MVLQYGRGTGRDMFGWEAINLAVGVCTSDRSHEIPPQVSDIRTAFYPKIPAATSSSIIGDMQLEAKNRP